MLKIAFIVGRFPLLSEAFILNQITGLIDRGHEVYIYALGGLPLDTSKVHPNVEKYRLIERTYYSPKIPNNQVLRAIKALKLILANWDTAPSVWLQLLNVFKYGQQAASLRLLYQAVPLLRKEQYDIVHCQFGTFGLMGLLFRNLGLIEGKLITTFRGYDISWAIQEFGDRVYNQLFEQGDFFLANCEFFRRRVLKLGCPEEKIIVHGSGIDCSKFAFTPRYLQPDSPVRIATTGRLVEKKG